MWLIGGLNGIYKYTFFTGGIRGMGKLSLNKFGVFWEANGFKTACCGHTFLKYPELGIFSFGNYLYF